MNLHRFIPSLGSVTMLCLLVGCQAQVEPDDPADIGTLDAVEDQADGGSDLGAGDADPPLTPSLASLVADYERGAIDLTSFRRAVSDHPHPPASNATGLPPGLTLLKGTYALDADTTWPSDTLVVLAPGTTVAIGPGVSLTIKGRVYAVGSARHPILIAGAPEAPYMSVTIQAAARVELQHTHLSGGTDLLTVKDTGDSPIIVRDGVFDHWIDVGLRFDGAHGLVVDRCAFGLLSDPESHGEHINGRASGATISNGTFGLVTHYTDAMDIEDCGAHTPQIIGNTFLGGEDDAIDLDRCDALVAGNLITDFWPPNPSAPYKGVNGGGITGHASAPLLINNIIIHCFHGVGFKNDSRPILIHNTVIQGHIGVTLYRSSSDDPSPHGLLINNIITGNRAHDTGAPQDLVLNGKWWPTYDQSADIQATVETTHNIFGDDYGGVANVIGAPPFTWIEGLPYPSATAPGLPGPYALGPFEPSLVEPLLLTDHQGTSRPIQMTRGALEAP